jgi:hypothetical protein
MSPSSHSLGLIGTMHLWSVEISIKPDGKNDDGWFARSGSVCGLGIFGTDVDQYSTQACVGFVCRDVWVRGVEEDARCHFIAHADRWVGPPNPMCASHFSNAAG